MAQSYAGRRRSDGSDKMKAANDAVVMIEEED